MAKRIHRGVPIIYIPDGFDIYEVMDFDDRDFFDEDPVDIEEVIAQYERDQEGYL